MESLRWSDVLRELVQEGDDPRATIARFGREAEQREREAEALRNLALAIRELAPNADERGTEPARVSRPDEQQGRQARSSGIDTIRAIMRAGGVWSPKMLLDEMEKRGMTPNSKTPIRSVEAAVNRLWRERKEIERVGRAQYTWVQGPPASPSLKNLSEHADSIGASIEVASRDNLPASDEAKE